jgi:hypothetical protein
VLAADSLLAFRRGRPRVTLDEPAPETH